MAKKSPTKLEVAVKYLKKIAETTYVGSPDSEIVKRLRSFARQGLAAVEAAESVTAPAKGK